MIALILLIGTLSMTFAEVFSGASQIWFFDVWGLFITYPLYLGHLLFFLNLSMKTKRTSIPQLYLWGMLFGLYESWITKVLWWGYPGSEGAILGLFLGIATFEFIVLILFWHPIFSFILPILIFEVLSLSVDNEESIDAKIFRSHTGFLRKRSKILLLYIFLFLFGSFLAIGTYCNLFLDYFSLLGSLALILLFYFIGKKRNRDKFSIRSFKLGKKGFTLVTSYIIFFNLITFFILLPERAPADIIPYLIIIACYAIILILLKISDPIDENIDLANISLDDKLNLKHILFLFIFEIVFLFLICILDEVGVIFVFILNDGLLLIGPIVLIVMIYGTFKKKSVDKNE